jgi:hypothetical protein
MIMRSYAAEWFERGEHDIEVDLKEKLKDWKMPNQRDAQQRWQR